MRIRLNFRTDPAAPYHTLFFHYRQGVKEKLFQFQSDETLFTHWVKSTRSALNRLLGISDDHYLVILPSASHLIPILNAEPTGSVYRHRSGYEGIFRALPANRLTGDAAEPAGNHGSGDLYLTLIDLNTGFRMAAMDPGRKETGLVHQDLSISMFEKEIDMDGDSSLFFNTRFFCGLYPGLVFWFVGSDAFNLHYSDRLHQADFIGEDRTFSHREVHLLDLYALHQVFEDMIRLEPKVIRNEVIYKSMLLTGAIERSKRFELLIQDEGIRSHSVIAARSLMSTEDTHQFFNKAGIDLNIDHTEGTGNVIRIANQPVHSKEQAGYLADILEGN